VPHRKSSPLFRASLLAMLSALVGACSTPRTPSPPPVASVPAASEPQSAHAAGASNDPGVITKGILTPDIQGQIPKGNLGNPPTDSFSAVM